MKVGSFCIWKG